MGLSFLRRVGIRKSGRNLRDAWGIRTAGMLQAEPLEGRLMLSRAVHAAHADLLAPPAAEVANATSALQSTAGPDFQKLAADLGSIEQSSKVRRGQFALLEYDAATLDEAIASASSLTTKRAANQLNALQNTLDQSFLAAGNTRGAWGQLEQKVASNLSGVIVNYVLSQSTVAATMPRGVVSNALVQDTYSQMKLIAREAGVTPAEHEQIVTDEEAVIRDLGANAEMNLGGSLPRDPLTVYMDGQVPNFVHTATIVRKR